MSSLQNLALLALLVASSVFSTLASSRDLPPRLAPPEKQKDFNLETLGDELASGLAAGNYKDDIAGGGLMDCWNALMELRSCSNEVVLFFLNGEAYLSIECCQAIRVITRHCWASMLGSLGFTAQEGDVLLGYCDAEEEEAAPPYSGLPLPTYEEPISPAVSQGRFL